MWWLDPGKEVLNVLFNRVLAPYVENLDMNQVNYGIGQGQISLGKLRLKKGALDKFRLPVDVLEGHLGKFTLSLHWMNLGNQPVEIFVEDVYLLVVPSPQTNVDPEEEESRAQAAKAERLENAELLHMKGRAEGQQDSSAQTQGLLQSLIAKIVNNVQVTVKNIHIRYEDKLSVPGHPFAAGVTLEGFTASSVNENWESAFIESSAGAIHKLAKLHSLAVYFDTDSPSMAGLPLPESLAKFRSMISGKKGNADHQFILKPVSGEGRVVMHHRIDPKTPRFDVQLLFDTIGISLDNNQYRDALSLVDMYHVYVRQHQYRKFRPNADQIKANAAQARLRFAGQAILNGVQEKNKKWTWGYFASRRDDRRKYVELFKKKMLSASLSPVDASAIAALEKKLSYEDIRFYRSIARSDLKKDQELRKRLEEQKKAQASQQSWSSWLWGSSNQEKEKDAAFGGNMTEEQRKQLYDVLDYDEKSDLIDSFQAPKDALKLRVVAKLKTGSFSLRSDQKDVISIRFESFQSNVLQRTDNLEAAISLGGFSVFDGTAANSLHPQIVRVKKGSSPSDTPIHTLPVDQKSPVEEISLEEDSFFYFKFEANPLDERADNALTVRMRHMEIIYHKGYVEAVYKFFKPPASQLESVEALLDVASQTLDGLRKDTRAGLEYALQTHKTIDIKMDMNAPIIIVPEDISVEDCKHLVIDAGHISIESNHADKEALREIQLKRNQKYEDEDYKRLESLMYDKVFLKLKDAQFLIGNDLQSCLDALTSKDGDSLHLVERISIDLQVQNSIVPSALNLARFKVTGNLPSLEVNLSDTKYKALMRLVDVCIPHFEDEAPAMSRPPVKPSIGAVSSGFQLPALFGSTSEYNVDEGGEDETKDDDAKEEFFEANDGSEQRPDLHQQIFVLDFTVDELKASITKTGRDGVEKPIGDVCLRRFDLDFALAKYDMKVDITLRSLTMNLVQNGLQPIKFMSSADSEQTANKDLLKVHYQRAQKVSPEFESVYEGIDQSVDIQISTFIFRAAPEPVIALYDFVMTTFVPNTNNTVVQAKSAPPMPNMGVLPAGDQPPHASQDSDSGKIRVKIQLDSVQLKLIKDEIQLATLLLSTADVMVLLVSGSMNVGVRLGSLALSNDSTVHYVLPEFNQILSIEGNDFAEFRYQTFDRDAEDYDGIQSSVYLRAASVKIHFLEGPLHDIYLFLIQLAKLKGLYDTAAQAAVQSASEIELVRMHYEISIKSPIVILPSDASKSQDHLVMRLGEVSVKNRVEQSVNHISASLKGIHLKSKLFYEPGPSQLKIIDDIDVTADVKQASALGRTPENNYPDSQVNVRISDVRLQLTQTQYSILMAIAQAVPRVLSSPISPEEEDGSPSASAPLSVSSTVSSVTSLDSSMLTGLSPELRPAPSVSSQIWTTIDLLVTVGSVKLHLFDGQATHADNLKEHGIARFALNDNSLRLKMLSDGALEAQVVLKSFLISNTRPGSSKFREIIPTADHDRNQFMLLYTQSGNSAGLAVLTVDSPKVIFAIDPVFALLEFVLSAFKSQTSNQETATMHTEATQATHLSEAPQPSQGQQLDFRIDLHDVSLSVLENDADPESLALSLSISQFLMSQQGVLAINMQKLGMSLIKMNKRAEDIRLLDELDMTFSLDSRSSSSQVMQSIELNSRPIVLRASYRDINVIMSIVNKAIEMYLQTQQKPQSTDVQAPSAQSFAVTPRSTKATRSDQPVGKASVVVSKEQFRGTIDGFRLILIGDMYEQPMFHLNVKPFDVSAKDWSGELSATATIATQISFWNLTNSHWEPFIDPWTFSLSITKESPTAGPELTLSAQERLDINISTTFVELVLAMMKVWGQESIRSLKSSRGSYAPYRIKNCTGSPIYVWADADGSTTSKDNSAVMISDGQTVDWRFDDWKTMREHMSSHAQQNIGVQLVGKPFENLRSIPIDREGEFTFSLKPRVDKFPSRILCQVKLENNVKIATIRSTYVVENLTLYPLEVTLVDAEGHPVYSLQKIAPGSEFALPVEAVMQNRIRLQPDQGFGYKWCSAIRWEDVVAKKSFTIKCPHSDPKEAAFRFQAWVETDAKGPISRFPKIALQLRAPIELENLLPHNIEYRIFDKDTNQNWRSFLRKGGIMPIHSVELGHLVLLNVFVQDSVYKQSEFSIINTNENSEYDIENRLLLRDAKDRTLDISLNYVRYQNSGGAFKLQIYSPYLIVNKTGLPFYVRCVRRTGASQDASGETDADVLAAPSAMMLSHPSEQGHEFAFKLGDSHWSKTVSLKAPSAEMELSIPSRSRRDEEIRAGLSWGPGSGKYKLTRTITLAPRFLIKNMTQQDLCFREHGITPRDRCVVSPGQRHPFTVMNSSDQRLLTFAFTGLNATWSPPVNIENIGVIYFRLQTPNVADSIRLIKSTVEIEGSTIFVTLSSADQEWPFRIENESQYPVSFYQKTEDGASKPGPIYNIAALGQTNYAWDLPAAPEPKLVLNINGSQRTIDIKEIGNLMPFKFRHNNRNKAVSLDVRADGPQQILRITTYHAESSVYKPRRADMGTLQRSDTITSSTEIFEAVAEDVPPSITFNIDFSGIGVSMVNRKVVEVLYVSLNQIKLSYSTSPVAHTINISCGHLQVDNQLHDAIFPVILQPTPITKEATGIAALPTLQASLILLRDEEHGVTFVKYCSILLQALTVECDEDLLFSLIDLSKIRGASWEEETQDILVQDVDRIPEPSKNSSVQQLYFEVLELQPIKILLSFMRTERVSSDDKLNIRNPLAVLFNAALMAVGNVNDAPLEFNALAIKDMRLTPPDLQSRVMMHYSREALRQFYRVIGSADLFGNPVGLFNNVSSGVADIFYEPFNGVVVHGNKELGIGIAKGAASFVKKTVFGVSDSFTKITGSVGKGISAATFDSEYQARRRMAQRRNRPRHAIYGVTSGGEAFATSMASAVEGVVMKPIEGAESGGAFGFFKGVGKGLAGVVTKPVVGIFDLASNVSEGIRNTTTVFDSPDRDRTRFPRHTPSDGVMRPYSEREALGQYWMKDLDNGAYRNESYVAHINTPGGDNVVLLTTTRVLSFWSKRLRLDWELPFSNVQGVTVEDNGIRFSHKAGREQDKFVFVPDKSSQSWFFGQIAGVVKNLNARRRMDS